MMPKLTSNPRTSNNSRPYTILLLSGGEVAARRLRRDEREWEEVEVGMARASGVGIRLLTYGILPLLAFLY